MMAFYVYAVITLGFSSQHFIFNAIQRLINYLPIYLFTYLPIYLFTYLPIYLFTYLPIYLFAFKLVDPELICMSF
ncbi:hypothetical protein Sbal625DRAFT_2748 [Shewanella baltica OS625]|nr:hypothetical protein Sbal625DRAFT_2748 [Shewanella baltica OS625]